MKKLILIFGLLLPTLLFAQQDSTKQTFKIGICKTVVAGKSRNKDTIPIEALSEPSLVTIGCGEVLEFSISFQADDGVWQNGTTAGNRFTNALLFRLVNKKPKYFYIIIQDIIYKSSTGEKRTAKGITLVVKNK
jgi:hypothetical protein